MGRRTTTITAREITVIEIKADALRRNDA